MSEFTEGPAYRETCKYCAYCMATDKNDIGRCYYNQIFGSHRVRLDGTCPKFFYKTENSKMCAVARRYVIVSDINRDCKCLDCTEPACQLCSVFMDKIMTQQNMLCANEKCNLCINQR